MDYILNKILIVVVFAGFLFVGCGDEESETQWHKGNLHTHSYWSDGDDYPEMIMKWYKGNGYDFVALSDHNTLAEGEKWIEPEKDSQHEKTFQNYLDEYGEDWVEFEENEDHYRVRLKTLEEYRTLFEEEGQFLVLKSEEITDGFEDKPIHVNATNIQELIEPQGGNSVVDVMQNNIDAVHEQREETGEPMFPHINHPNFGWSITADDLKKLEGERFFEVYNGHPHVHNEGDSLRSGTEQMWDEVITHYLLEGKPVMYGIAVDDAHHYHEMDNDHANPGRGWIQVKSQKLSPDSIIAAMERGDFYSTNGISLKEIDFNGEMLSIDIDAEEGVNYTTEFIGTHSDSTGDIGTLFKTEEGTEPAYTFSGGEIYIRAKITSDKKKENPYSEGEFEVAWVQPVMSE
ncbi:MAG: histidinol-phosphatase [Bacteroidota bacterium]